MAAAKANITIIKAATTAPATTAPATTAPATTFDTIGAFKSIAGSLASIEANQNVVDVMIEACREAGVKIGKSKKDMVRAQLLDALKEAFPERSEKTLANYMTSLAASINDGVPFSKSSSKGSTKDKSEETDGEGEGASAQKAKGKTDEEKMYGALVNVWKLSDVAANILEDIENMMMSEDWTLIEAIEYVLGGAGYDLKK